MSTLLTNLGPALSAVFTIENLVGSLIGTILGVLIGALPGFTPSMGIAVLIPLTFGMDVTWSLIFLAALYCGATYGGSISAILVNTPGTPAAAATVLDGFPMTQQGKAKDALTEAAVASWWGGWLSALALLLIAPPLAAFSLRFSFPEKFLLAVFGLTIISSLSVKTMLKGLIAGVFGLAISIVGMDMFYGTPRFTFGVSDLLGGVALVPALIGIYSIPQVVEMITSKQEYIVDEKQIRDIKNQKTPLIELLKSLVRYPWVYIRSAVIGIVIGIIPGAGGNIASFISYNQGKMRSKHRSEYGTGCREGVACSEAANNGVTGGAMIPMLTLGIPGNAVSAILLGALMIHGLIPGSNLFTVHASTVYPFIIALFVSNLFMLLIGLFGATYFSRVALIPANILAACIMVLCVTGSFALKKSMTDVITMLVFGLIGCVFRYFKYSPTPVVLGMILGSMAEQGFRQSLLMCGGTAAKMIKFFANRPLCLALMVIIVASVVLPIIQYNRDNRKKQAAPASESGNKE